MLIKTYMGLRYNMAIFLRLWEMVLLFKDVFGGIDSAFVALLTALFDTCSEMEYMSDAKMLFFSVNVGLF